MSGWLRVLAAERLKLRRTFAVGLAALGPTGVIALQAVHFGIRYEYLMDLYASDLWGGLLWNVTWLAVPTLMVGIAIVASLAAGYEHATNAWKQTLALPVSRTAVYTAKLAVLVMLLTGSCALLAIGTVGLGWALGFGAAVPITDVLGASFVPLAAALPFAALQTWLSIALKHQAAPLTVGILGTVVSMFAPMLADWAPWTWPYAWFEGVPAATAAAAGAATGAALWAAGALHFKRKDVS
ncbi:ABC transporter permease [Paenibacillus sp.]|uniref:ABC transporter permease n=1 Tax=Paenibacillus sp. TaxID=58172 RepID=UPI002D2E9B4F|nr:ABC transporter permease [Paenibacillus sp.]HZG84752.1 ABC transporter permease [Paenibacillus sp.]